MEAISGGQKTVPRVPIPHSLHRVIVNCPRRSLGDRLDTHRHTEAPRVAFKRRRHFKHEAWKIKLAIFKSRRLYRLGIISRLPFSLTRESFRSRPSLHFASTRSRQNFLLNVLRNLFFFHHHHRLINFSPITTGNCFFVLSSHLQLFWRTLIV